MSRASSTTFTRDVEEEMLGGKSSVLDPFEVLLEAGEHPQHLSTLRKWIAVVVISCAALCVTCSSSVVRWSKRDLKSN